MIALTAAVPRLGRAASEVGLHSIGQVAGDVDRLGIESGKLGFERHGRKRAAPERRVGPG
jgi:hypothetical protein